jgi:OmpA-OmpF porin, OOP family
VEKLLLILASLGLLLLFVLCPWKHWSEIETMQKGSSLANVANVNSNRTSNTNVTLGAASLKVTSENGKYRLIGTVPDEASKQQLLAKAKEVYGDGNFIDELKVGGVSKPDWLASAISLFSFTKNGVKNGGLSVEGTSISLIGEVASEAEKSKIFAEASKLLSPTSVNNLLTVAGQKALSSEQAKTQVKLNEAISGKIIEFETGSDKLTAKGTAVLDSILPTIKDSAENLQIEGHTDNAGNPAKNLDLSKRRAETVKKYFVDKSIDAGRFKTAGFGQDKPIADNNTAEGKQRNRRIEFQVTGGKQ